LSLLFNIKRLLGIAVPIPGILCDRGHFHAMVKVEKYESIHGRLVDLGPERLLRALIYLKLSAPPFFLLKPYYHTSHN
jgi:hypothetical protein